MTDQSGLGGLIVDVADDTGPTIGLDGAGRLVSVTHADGSVEIYLDGTPYRDKTNLYNAAHLIYDGEIIATRMKHELPNYGVFDEKRYFVPGDLPDPIEFMGLRLGVMICEDMWLPTVTDHLIKHQADILIVMNGSPYHTHQHQIRLQHAELRVKKSNLPLIYVNQVGGQDDLVFDGASFMMNQSGSIIMQCEEFVEEFQDVTLTRTADGKWLQSTETIHAPHPQTEAMYQAVMTGLRDYVTKNAMNGVLIGMSGGCQHAAEIEEMDGIARVGIAHCQALQHEKCHDCSGAKVRRDHALHVD